MLDSGRATYWKTCHIFDYDLRTNCLSVRQVHRGVKYLFLLFDFDW